MSEQLDAAKEAERLYGAEFGPLTGQTKRVADLIRRAKREALIVAARRLDDWQFHERGVGAACDELYRLAAEYEKPK